MRSARTAVAGLAPALALALAACGGADPGSTGGSDNSPAGEPRSGGTLTVAYPEDPGCWDFQNGQGATLVPIQRNLFDGLVHQAQNGDIVPWLAESWDISEDGTSYTFRLRTDVTFSDGTPLDAEAVKTSFDRLTSEETASRSYAGNFPYAGAEALDDHTVRIDLSEPHAPFLQIAASPGGAILSPAAAAHDVETLCGGGELLVGSGPFVVADYAPNDHITLTRNPDYAWPPEGSGHEGPAYLDEVTFTFLNESSVRIGALTSGQVDYAYDIAPADYNALPEGEYTKLKALNAGSPDLWLLNTSRAPFDDPDVRTALLRGIDIGTIIDTIYQGTDERAWSVLTPDTPYYDAGLENSWPHDPDLAEELLDEAGWTERDGDGYRVRDGERLSARWLINGDSADTLDTTLAEALQEAAKRIGVEVVLETVDAGTFAERGEANDYEIVRQGTNRAEAHILGSNLFSSWALPENRLHNYARVQDPQVDEWLLAASTTTDDDIRARNYAEVQRWVLDNAVAVPLQVRAWLGATGSRVHDVTYDIVGFPELLYDTWIEE
ncbi:ABC transporter substrate-binding protein [Streptomyces sp. NBRC 109706]|uniref:ABC transporter substrate-binding protein n=1 Tax=Streptomyces sp. NBRC 109706 TaxID=1550035 RepID=UPI000785CAC5|nr:ABC transporter substrate-binding protein [Streptomyces sp. NBRC 109706]